MKLPRWLSPVRTVEAETGWPRPFCNRFARHVQYQHWRDVLVWSLIGAAIVWPWFHVAGWLLPRLLSRDQIVQAPWVVAPGIFILPPPIFIGVAVLIVYRRWTLRALAAFRTAPWCLKCRYPVLETAQAEQAPVCPECGEPIPPEIASLAARQVKQAEG